MKLFLQFFPILLFFVAYKLWGIYAATLVAGASILLQIAHQWLTQKKVDTLHWVTLGLLLTFGGATFFFHDPLFIKLKLTAVDWLMALAFLVTHWFGKTLLIQRLMGTQLILPTHCWRRLNTSWVVFFTLMGLVNLYVIYHFTTDAWVNFKLFGTLIGTLLFVFAQAAYISKYLNLTETRCNAK